MPKNNEKEGKKYDYYRPALSQDIHDFYEKYLNQNPEMGGSVLDMINYVIRKDIEARKKEMKK